MRRSGYFVIGLAVLAALGFSGCGSEEPPDVFGEYIRSTEVENDRVENFGGPEDRLANFAAHGSVDQLQSALLSAFPCEDGYPGGGGSLISTTCDPPGAVPKAAEGFAGKDYELYGRSIIVRHGDGSLALLTLYVAQKPDGSAIVIDETGETYTDLAGFQSDNGLLNRDDWINTPENLTSVPGEGAIVTVPGSTAWGWWIWLALAAGGLAAIVAVVWVVRRIITRDDHVGAV